MEKGQDSAPRLLSEEEIERMLGLPDLDTVAGLRDRAVLELLCGTGLKVRELTGLRLENLDLQISCLLLSEGTGGEGVRMVPFGKRTRTILLRYVYAVRRDSEGPSSLVFPGRDKKELSRQAVWKTVRKYAAAAGIGHPVSPEDLRASLAVSLLRAGADPAGVRQMLGIREAALKRYLVFCGQSPERPLVLEAAAGRNPGGNRI